MSVAKRTLAAALLSLPLITSGSFSGGAAFAAGVDHIAAAASLSFRVRETPVLIGRPQATSSYKVKVPVARVRISPRF